VVGLVLHAAGEQLGAFDRDRVAVHVEAGCDHPGRARRRELQPRQRETALVVLFRLAFKPQHRVDEVPGLVIDVVGEHPQADADLRGGEPDAGRLQHGLGEVLDQLAQLKVEVHHRFRRGAQHRVAE